MGDYCYTAVRVQQQPDAKPFYLFSVKADELLEWADVPRKKESFMAGYQRELLDRHQGISEFIQKSPLNVIPGAIIVAVPEGAVTISASDLVGAVRLEVHVKDLSFDQRLHQIADEFMARLGETEKASIQESPVVPLQESEEEDGDESAVVSDVPPESYLAKLAQELTQAATLELSSLTADRQTAVRDFVEGSSKPGRILDGQHRVFGAKDVSEFDVFLPIVLLPNLSTSEQVFHFYVLNNKAKPLTATELRSTISTSLSNQEITNLYDRFKQAGVTEAEAARWTHRASNDEGSPFLGLIDFGLGNSAAFIPENVAYQLIGKFLKMPRKYKLLFGKVEAWVNDAAYDYRLGLFYALWNAVRNKYPKAWDQAVADRKGQILTKAGMVVLQELILDRLNSSMPGRAAKDQPSPLASYDELAVAVAAELHFLPEEFFIREWQEKQLDTSDRRKFLLGQMSEAIARAGTKLGTLPLFKTKSA